MPCELTTCVCNNLQKPYCKHWLPGRSSKYYLCSRYINGRVTCALPNTACATCEFHLADTPPRERKIDWDDPAAVKERNRKYMQAYRVKQKLAKGSADKTSESDRPEGDPA